MRQEKISAIIIDDDPLFCEHLKDLLAKSVKEVNVVEICNTAESGLKAIAAVNPQLVFLDVEMPDMNGFEMLKKIKNISFEIIFTTSFEYYAIRAIRFAAIDYLLKPLQLDMLQEAVSRAIEKISKMNIASNRLPAAVIKEINEPQLSNLAIPTIDGFIFLKTEDIIRCEADDRYTTLFTTDKKNITASRTLGDFEELLQHSGFVRIHHMHLINLKHLKKYLKGEGGQVIMSDGKALDVSRRKKEALLKAVPQFK